MDQWERQTVPALVRRWAGEQPDRLFVVTDADALTYGELERRSAALARALRRQRCRQGHAGRAPCRTAPRGRPWRSVRAVPARPSFPSAFLRPPELAAQLRIAGVEHLVLVRAFLARDGLADLMAISPDLVPGRRLVEVMLRLRSITVWADDLPGGLRRPPPRPRGRAATRPSARPTTSRSSSPPAVAATPKGVIHTHGGAARATAAGLDVRRVTPRRPALHPDALLLGRRVRHRLALHAHRRGDAPHRGPPGARRAPCPSSNVNGSRSSGAGPTRPPRLAPRSGFAAPTCRRCARAASTRCRPAAAGGPGRRARTCSGMTEPFGPYSGVSPRPRRFPWARKGAAAGRSPARAAHRRPRHRRRRRCREDWRAPSCAAPT